MQCIVGQLGRAHINYGFAVHHNGGAVGNRGGGFGQKLHCLLIGYNRVGLNIGSHSYIFSEVNLTISQCFLFSQKIGDDGFGLRLTFYGSDLAIVNHNSGRRG